MTLHSLNHRRAGAFAVAFICVATVTASLVTGAGRKFYDDDPLMREVDTQDASAAKPWDIDLIWDLSLNLFATPAQVTNSPRAGNINTVDEVPDSNWFTNRIGTHPVSVEAITRGPLEGEGPAAGTLTITRPKLVGASPGFTMRDSRNQLWFVSFDARGFPEAATGAVLVANKLMWALGYWQVENHLTSIRPDRLQIAETAVMTPPSGKRRPMRQSDLNEVLRRAHRSADGSYRAVAARAVPGTPIGGFRYHGTRPDDPNDIVPHEDRRELRALKVFGAWINLVDMKAGNTLDTLIEQDGRRVVRHYLQDVGSTFGVAAAGPHDYDEGWEHLYQGGATMARLATFGFYIRPWQTVSYANVPAIGRFEGDVFDPMEWRPRVPNAALLRARADDGFWAARRLAAFSDELIRAAAKTGQYSEPASAEHLASVLIKRRDRIVRAYLPAINPLVDFKMDSGGTLTFANAAVQANAAAAPKGYSAQWARFDNLSGTATAIGSPVAAATASIAAPSGLPSESGAYIKVQIRATDAPHAAWTTPVDVYFRRSAAGWTLVGIERMP